MKNTVRVDRYIGGSYCVIHIPRGDYYIDARKDRRQPDFTLIEIVNNGHVIFREDVHNSEAPERLIALTKYSLNGGTYDNRRPEKTYSRSRC